MILSSSIELTPLLSSNNKNAKFPFALQSQCHQIYLNSYKKRLCTHSHYRRVGECMPFLEFPSYFRASIIVQATKNKIVEQAAMVTCTVSTLSRNSIFSRINYTS